MFGLHSIVRFVWFSFHRTGMHRGLEILRRKCYFFIYFFFLSSRSDLCYISPRKTCLSILITAAVAQHKIRESNESYDLRKYDSEPRVIGNNLLLLYYCVAHKSSGSSMTISTNKQQIISFII